MISPETSVSEAEVEAAAREIYDAELEDCSRAIYWVDQFDSEKRQYLRQARAALTAAAQVRAQAQTMPTPEAVLLQARRAEGGPWINIWPAQLNWVAKEGLEVRAVESAALGIRKGE